MTADLPSLPPRVEGPVRYHLTVSMSKLLWTGGQSPQSQPSASPRSSGAQSYSRHPSATAATAAGTLLHPPYIPWHWWGEPFRPQPAPTFYPQVLGKYSAVSGAAAAAAAAATTTTNGNTTSSTTPALDNTLQFPVRCARKQLQSYFEDLGVVVLRVLESKTDRLLGFVFVKDLAQVASSGAGGGAGGSTATTPGRSINGFLPILAPQQQPPLETMSPTKRKPIDWQTVNRTSVVPSKGFTKVGEVHLMVQLETLDQHRSLSPQKGILLNAPGMSPERYLTMNPSSRTAATLAESEPAVEAPPVPTAMPTRMMPQTEITMFSQSSSPVKPGSTDPSTARIFPSGSPAKKRVDFAEASRDAPSSVEAARNTNPISKDKLSIVYERAKQLKAEMMRSMQNTEEDSLFEPESMVVAERSELFMTKDDVEDFMDDDLMVIQTLNSKAGNDALTRHLLDDEDLSTIGDVISMDSEMIDLEMDQVPSRETEQGISRTDKKLASMFLHLGRVDSVRVDIQEVNISTSKPLHVHLLLPNETSDLYSISMSDTDRQGKIILPVMFNEDLAQKWMDEHVILRVSDGEQLDCVAGISCAQLLENSNLLWEGRLPLWKVASSEESITNRAAFMRLTERSTTEIAGNIKFSIKLRSPASVEQAAPLEVEMPVGRDTVSFYVFVHVGHVQKLGVKAVAGHETSVYLSTRFAHLSGNIMETHPIPVQSDQYVDFNFHYTAPFTMDVASLAKHEFLMVEVWSMMIPEHVPFETDEPVSMFAKRQMVGLIKLPLGVLLKSVREHLRMQQMELPTMIPSAEYPIVNLLSGDYRGWAVCTLAAGTLKQVNHLKEELELDKPEPVKVVKQSELKDRSAQVSLDHVATAAFSKSLGATSAAATSAPASRVQVSIHRACGLGSAIHDESRDFAVELSMFPPELMPGEIPATVQTPFVKGSCTPVFEHSQVITFSSLSTRLIMWIQNGGKAQGSLVQRDANGDQFVLGHFDIPLETLLARSIGIRNQWFPISSSSSQKVGAVELSVCLLNGFDSGLLNSDEPIVHYNTQDLGAICRLELLADVPAGISAQWRLKSLRKDLESSTLGGWTSFAQSRSSVDVEVSLALTNLFKYGLIEIRFQSDEEYAGSAFIESDTLGSHLSRWIRNAKGNRMGLSSEITLAGDYDLIDPTSEVYSGRSIHVDILMSIDGSKSVAEIKRLKTASPEPVLPRDHVKSTATAAASSVTNSKKITSISKYAASSAKCMPIHITVERALHLQKVMTSDAVGESDPHRSQSPNAYVTLEWMLPTGDREVCRSSVQPNDLCPVWNFNLCVEQSLETSALRSLKETPLQFHLWHRSDTDQSMDKLLGIATVDLAPLFHGFHVLRGWYRILNKQNRPVGEISIQVQPFESLFIPAPDRAISPPKSLHASLDERQRHGHVEAAFASSVPGRFVSDTASRGGSSRSAPPSKAASPSKPQQDSKRSKPPTTKSPATKSPSPKSPTKPSEVQRSKSPTRSSPIKLDRSKSPSKSPTKQESMTKEDPSSTKQEEFNQTVSTFKASTTATDYSLDDHGNSLRDKLRQSIVGLEEVHVKLTERLRMRSPDRQRPVSRHESDGQFFAASAEQDQEKSTIFFGGPMDLSMRATDAQADTTVDEQLRLEDLDVPEGKMEEMLDQISEISMSVKSASPGKERLASGNRSQNASVQTLTHRQSQNASVQTFEEARQSTNTGTQMEKTMPEQEILQHKGTQIEESEVAVRADEPTSTAAMSKSSSKASLLSPLESNLPLSLSKEETERITRIFSNRPPIPPIARGSSWGDLTKSTNAVEREQTSVDSSRSGGAPTARPMSAPLTSVVGWSFGVPREVPRKEEKKGIDETTEEEDDD